MAYNGCGLAKERDLKIFRSAIVPQFISGKMFIACYRSLSFAKPFVRRLLRLIITLWFTGVDNFICLLRKLYVSLLY